MHETLFLFIGKNGTTQCTEGFTCYDILLLSFIKFFEEQQSGTL
jgi:hypothetical protein